jgi:chromosome segregation and condensation protein ScpB
MGLIHRRKEGRSTIINTTDDFRDYLGLSNDRRTMRRQLRSIFRKLEMDQMEKK